MSAQPLLSQQQQAVRRAYSVTQKWHKWWKRLIDARAAAVLNFMNNRLASLSLSPAPPLSAPCNHSHVSSLTTSVDRVAFPRGH